MLGVDLEVVDPGAGKRFGNQGRAETQLEAERRATGEHLGLRGIDLHGNPVSCVITARSAGRSFELAVKLTFAP